MSSQNFTDRKLGVRSVEEPLHVSLVFQMFTSQLVKRLLHIWHFPGNFPDLDEIQIMFSLSTHFVSVVYIKTFLK